MTIILALLIQDVRQLVRILETAHYGDLLPEWKDRSRLSIRVRPADGGIRDIEFPIRDQLVNPVDPPTRVEMPSIEKSRIIDGFLAFAKGVSLDEINRDRAVPLERNDDDFSGETVGEKTTREDPMSWWAKYPETAEEQRTERPGVICCPQHVVVLCNERTFGAGYDMMRNLHHNAVVLCALESFPVSTGARRDRR